MRSFAIFILIGCIIGSCGNDSDKQERTETPFDEITFESDTTLIDNEFPQFPFAEMPKILEQLGFCTNDSEKAKDGISICSSELFRVFPLDTTFDYTKGFIVDTRIGVLSNSTTKALLVLIYRDGKFNLVNLLKGKILEFRTNLDGRYDLVMKYRDSGIPGYVTVLHQWDNRVGAYVPVKVEEINDYFIKEAYQDSLSDVYLKNFAWGY